MKLMASLILYFKKKSIGKELLHLELKRKTKNKFIAIITFSIPEMK